ncbi:MAG: anthranilate phosphoribosyltransferase, partial [Candidatus Omnitrophica bacterium]|nr:anthranilate phosphoribosyltransferase [Candidatus Omnitrophota bacterium]
DTVLDYGWFLDQQDLSPAMDRWVDLRQQIVKRPFMATLERFVNPCSSRVMLASAFHPPYGDKMLTICERAGFPAGIIVRNGMEGTLAFPLMRQARILCTARQADGTYRRREIIFDAQRILGKTYSVEERLEDPSLEENIRLIQRYTQDGQTGYAHFDDRVKVTCAGLQEALEWIKLYGAE